MGSIQKREDRPGYIARWRDPDGNRRSKSFRTKGEAVRFVTKMEADKMDGNYLDPRRARMTVATWSEQFRELRARKRPGTVEREEASLRAHLLPAFGNRAMGSIRRLDLQRYVDALAAELAPSTVRREYGLLHVFFQEAVDMDPPVMLRNPCKKIVLPDPEDQEQRFFTAAEIEALYEAFDLRFGVMVLVGCYAGLRIGEQAALREMDLLFASGQIHVRQGAFEPERGPIEFGPLKTRYSRGRVDVPVFLLDELTAHRKRFPSPTDGPAAGRVFTNARGGPLRPRNWRRRFWAEAVARAGLGPATPHAMRHTFVSLLIDQGLSVEKVAEQARHRDPGFTWRVYRHRFEQRAVAGTSDSALAMENVRARAVAARRPGGRRGDGPDLRLLGGTAERGVDPS